MTDSVDSDVLAEFLGKPLLSVTFTAEVRNHAICDVVPARLIIEQVLLAKGALNNLPFHLTPP